MDRRNFLKILGLGTTVALTGCKSKEQEQIDEEYANQQEPPMGKMSYRKTPTTGDKVSLLGYGMMRLPMKETDETDENGKKKEIIDQEQVNKLVDYAMAHGVNYYDTSPAYCRGKSEESTGIALHRHPRESYYVATKLSNFSPETWSAEASKEMFYNSLKYLQVDYIDYYLLHGIGMGGMESLEGRYTGNGILDWLIAQRKSGKIRNLGFSYHGDIEVFDYLLTMQDEGKITWDFVQIELNYLDWDYADEINDRNTDARYLYGELSKRDIPSVIMEPLLGGRLANVPKYLSKDLKKRNPNRSVASWAFRYAGTPAKVLTVLSGMTYMEHLKDNLISYCPFEPLSKEECEYLEKDVAKQLFNIETIPCNDCKYCMPCPYGIDIPGIFVHYNKFRNEGTLPNNNESPEYRKLRNNYLISLTRTIGKERQADHCIGCRQCEEHCPQGIRIAKEMSKIDEFIEKLKQDV